MKSQLNHFHFLRMSLYSVLQHKVSLSSSLNCTSDQTGPEAHHVYLFQQEGPVCPLYKRQACPWWACSGRKASTSGSEGRNLWTQRNPSGGGRLQSNAWSVSHFQDVTGVPQEEEEDQQALGERTGKTVECCHCLPHCSPQPIVDCRYATRAGWCRRPVVCFIRLKGKTMQIAACFKRYFP